MKVLHVISGLDRRSGGTTTALLGMATAQKHAGIDVTIFSTFYRGADHDAVEDLGRNGIDVELVGPAVRQLVSWHPAISRKLRRRILEADVVHIHGLWEEVQHRAAKLCRQITKPYVITPHGMLAKWSLAQKAAKKRLYLLWRLRADLNGAAAINFTTVGERDDTLSLDLTAPPLIETLGLSLEEFTDPPPKGFLRQRFPSIGSRQIVLFLGRLHPKKGLDILIPAFAGIDSKTAVLVLAGPVDQSYEAKVRGMVANAGIADRTFFTGMLFGRDRIAALVDGDLFALTSYQENFGISVLESMASGTPVLVSDQVNIFHEVLQSESGRVTPATVQDTQPVLRELLSEPGMLVQMGAAAREYTFQRFDWSGIATRWQSHYERLIASFNAGGKRPSRSTS